MTINKRLAALREVMHQYQLDAYIIPTGDPHQSEYLADHWKSREWIGGFTGSAGTIVVTQKHAGLWTDVRYFLQAEQELSGTEVVLHKLQVQGAAEFATWLCENLEQGSRVGIDGMNFSYQQVASLGKMFDRAQIDLVTDNDLFEKIWKDRPALPKNPIFEHDVRLAGASRTEKLAQIREKMKAQGADFHLVCMLDEIAWTFNIRSNDVECNPVSIAYAVVSSINAYLFIDEQKVPSAIKSALEKDGIIVKPYQNIFPFIEVIPDSKTILIDPNTTNSVLYNAVTAKKIHGDSIPMTLKAMKNKTEQAHIRHAMVKDGVALVKAFRWLEQTLDKESVSEAFFAEKLIHFRSQQQDFVGESFSSIIGYKGNGAIIHYHPMPETCANIEKDGILLVDSGGQYLDGTTDITRTIALSKPTDEQKLHFTLVLKGHIALAMLKFPHGTRGVQMDVLARMALWQHGLNFGHGTGHGVGFFLNVHEPPQGFIAGLGQRGTTVMESGMLTSNEPGFYKTGEYGIRIENLVLTQEAETTAYGKFLYFENVTLYPIDRKLIDKKLLNKEELEWLNAYHEKVFDQLSPHLDIEEKTWLEKQCKKI